MRALLFYLLLLLALPLLVLGGLLHTIVVLRCRGRISGTAYRPLQSRLLLHGLGQRPDPAAQALAAQLPGTRGLLGWLLLRPLVWACRCSGHLPAALRLPPPQPLPLRALLVGRTAVFDRALEDALTQVDQVVILGAGWDTRAWGACLGRGVRVFEVDAPPTQAVKRRAVAAAGLDTNQLCFVACDFAQASWLDALAGAGFDRDRPAFVLWEGVTMYLGESQVRATLDDISGLAAGSRVAFDCFGREWLATLPGRLGARAVAWIYQEPFRFSLSTAAGHAGLRRLLEQHDLHPELTWLSDDEDPRAFYAILVGATRGPGAG